MAQTKKREVTKKKTIDKSTGTVFKQKTVKKDGVTRKKKESTTSIDPKTGEKVKHSKRKAVRKKSGKIKATYKKDKDSKGWIHKSKKKSEGEGSKKTVTVKKRKVNKRGTEKKREITMTEKRYQRKNKRQVKRASKGK